MSYIDHSNISRLLWVPAAALLALAAARSGTLCCCVTVCAGPDFDGCFVIAPLCIPLEGKPVSAFESVRPEVLRHHPPDRIQAWLSLHHC